jgi:hypothetical protein
VWGRCCVQVLVCEALQLKRVTIEGSGELYHKGRRRARRQGGEVAICVSRWGDQARRIVGQWPVKFVTPWRLKMRPVLHVAHEDATVWAGSPDHTFELSRQTANLQGVKTRRIKIWWQVKIKERLLAIILSSQILALELDFGKCKSGLGEFVLAGYRFLVSTYTSSSHVSRVLRLG